MSIPKIVFIVPYRNRVTHKYFFSQYLSSILTEEDKYEIYFSHQNDERPFNRGAAKNIGFIAVKEKYPNDYKNITFVFNDIDIVPFYKIFDYETTKGIVKHFYGFQYALGGIVSILGSDFEEINGYPNFWGWGMEDKILQERVEKQSMQIDRTHFYPIGSPEILQLFDGVSRIINKKEPLLAKNDKGIDGITSIKQCKFTIDGESANPLDNIYTILNENIFVVNIHHFISSRNVSNMSFFEYDLREPTNKIMQTDRKTDPQNFVYNNWSKIPFYPTLEQKQQMIQLYGKVKTEEMIKHNYRLSNELEPEPKLKPEPKQNTYNNFGYSASIGLGGVRK